MLTNYEENTAESSKKQFMQNLSLCTIIIVHMIRAKQEEHFMDYYTLCRPLVFNSISYITFTMYCSDTFFLQVLLSSWQQNDISSFCGETVLHWVKEIFCATLFFL